MNDFEISTDSSPFYLYTHASKSESEATSVLVKVSQAVVGVGKPSLSPKEVSEPPEWTIPCLIEKFQHENGRIQTGFSLVFHPESLHLAMKNREFAAQLRMAGLKSLGDHLTNACGVPNCRLTSEPPIEDYRQRFSEAFDCPRISQNQDSVILLWSFPRVFPACLSVEAEVEKTDITLATIKISLANGMPVGAYICRAESGKAFGAVRTSSTTSGKSFSLQLGKLDIGQSCEETEEEEAGDSAGQLGGPWTHLYIGTSKDGLSLVCK